MNKLKSVKGLFWLPLEILCYRIIVSLIPPISSKHKEIYVDLLGPSFASIILIVLLNYGIALKSIKSSLLPFEIILLYMLLMPLICLVLNKFARSWITFLEIISLIGYSQYGYIVILLTSHYFYLDNSDLVFFLNLIVFGGLSTLRLVLLQLTLISLPGARLLVCSTIAVLHILFLVYLHYTYMHPTFIYGKHLGT